MASLQRVLTGEEKRDYVRAVDSQPCLRVVGKHNDFEEVGLHAAPPDPVRDAGHWSLGTTSSATPSTGRGSTSPRSWGCRRRTGWRPRYTDDDEDHRIWADEIGPPPERLVRWGNIMEGDEKNFWRAGRHRPEWPAQRAALRPRDRVQRGRRPHPDHSEHCPRCAEVWNPGLHGVRSGQLTTLTPLPFKSVDTGMGPERITMVVQGWTPTTARICSSRSSSVAEFIGHDPETVESERFSYRGGRPPRAATLLIAEGVAPSNEGAATSCAGSPGRWWPRPADGHRGAVPPPDLRVLVTWVRPIRPGRAA